VIRIPCPAAANYIHRVQLHLIIPDIFHSSRIWRHGTVELLHLLRPEDANSYSATKSAWQRKLPSVDTLKISLTMKRGGRNYGVCLRGEERWTEMLRHVAVDIAARCVDVEVTGFKCDRVEQGMGVEMCPGPLYFRSIRVPAKGPCEFDCAGKVARAMREFLLEQRDRTQETEEAPWVEG
jgi:hypothetical protein